MNSLSDLAEVLLTEPHLWAREGLQTTLKPDGSPVTSADLRIDCLLREYLSERFPGIWIVSEEDSNTFDVPDVELLAQIDPLDGTENFLSGLPIWGVSVSLSRSRAHYCSLLAFPELGLSLSTGQSYAPYSSRIEGHASSTPLGQVVAMSRSSENRILGSAAFNLYCVATGRFSRFVNPSGARSWDILAGLNLAAEQGCEVLVDGAAYQGEFWTHVESIASRYSDRPIVILGKGASADDVAKQAFQNSFVVGINDAEYIAPVDVAVFHESWVLDRINSSPNNAEVYLTSVSVEGDRPGFFSGQYIPMTQDSTEFMYQRLLSDDLTIEQVMLLTALRIALRAAEHTGSPSIYLVGFDFSVRDGFSRRVDPNASHDSPSHQQHVIEFQQRVYLAIQAIRNSLPCRIQHVGYRPFSDLTPGALSERLLETSGGHSIASGTGSGVSITAEVTTNHGGEIARAKWMVRHAARQGAQYVKFQMRDVGTFYRPEVLEAPYPSPFGHTFREYREGLELSDADFVELADEARTQGVGWFASVLDRPSLMRAIELEMPMIKLPGTISRKTEFLELAAREFPGDIVVSTGMTAPPYAEWITNLLGRKRTIYLLHTNSAYPTPSEDCNVAVIRSYARMAEEYPNVIPGYSSHDDGWFFGSALAVACGAQMVEKHVKLGESEWLHFDAVALDLTTDAFRDYVAAIRRAEVTLGDEVKRITPSEHHKY